MTNDEFTDKIVSAEMWECHTKIIDLRNTVEQSFLMLGEELEKMKRWGAYRQLGEPTFESYLARPDVDIGRTSAYMAIHNYEVFVQRLNVDDALLLEAGTSKLTLIAPHVDEANADELVNMAAALSRSDLRDMLGQMFGDNATPPLPCDYRARYIWARRVLAQKYWKFRKEN